MNYKFPLMLLIGASCIFISETQHENIPYQDINNICDTCICLTTTDANRRIHNMLDCSRKNFQHILSRWPQEFGINHIGIDIVATFSGNNIQLLQQLPATNATVAFSCSHCGIKHLQIPLFMDVPNIERLDLSWNSLNSDELTPDLFRGPFGNTHYEPIALIDLDFSHNKFRTLDKKLFEHTPQLRRLNLSHNQLNSLDSGTTAALSSVHGLQTLDLSFNGLKQLPQNIFASLTQLSTLNLAGNMFSSMPPNLQPLGPHLLTLNIAGNQIVQLNSNSFTGLTALKHLNISDMPTLKNLTNSTLQPLLALEFLYCAHNTHLEHLELLDLLQCQNLTHLDISNSAISMLWLPKNTVIANETTLPWPKLRNLYLGGNPWYCDCELLTTLEYIGSQYRVELNDEKAARCDTPYIMAGAQLANLTAAQICAMKIPKKYRVIEEDPPRFLRKRYIILSLITASVVIVFGLVVGLIVVVIRRRLKNETYGIEPIRYTSVRGSNLSAAFPQLNGNYHGNNHTSNNNTGGCSGSQA